jgi:hypothetical protein
MDKMGVFADPCPGGQKPRSFAASCCPENGLPRTSATVTIIGDLLSLYCPLNVLVKKKTRNSFE